jgi:hypothetical protein
MKWLNAAVIGVGYIGWMVALWVSEATAPLDSSQLKSTTEELRSYAEEGRLLAEQTSRGRAPAVYRRPYAEKLVDLVDESQQTLTDESKMRAEVRPAARKLEKLRARASRQLEHLAAGDLRSVQATRVALDLRATVQALEAARRRP